VIHFVLSVIFLRQGLGINREVNVEPGLFEWLGWYIASVPKFMTLQELHDRSLPVNLAYSPIWPSAKYNVQETTEQFYERCYQVTKDILKKHESEGTLSCDRCANRS
jgi:ubiquitin-associated and SH3 domain-containing protein